MNQIVTQGIILSRIDYGEADRILTLLTPDQGKLRLLAKGVRRVKSKLAGGIELFSVSTITCVRGRGEIGTLVSTRLVKHYANIVHDLDRTMLGYELIKQLNKITEDQPGPEYFNLLQQAFKALDDADISLQVVRFWFSAQLLRLAGHTPNLQTDAAGHKLDAQQRYRFNLETMCFSDTTGQGSFAADDIKFLRLAFSTHPAKVLAQVQGSGRFLLELGPLVEKLMQLNS
jgi:DNA repair protein RecO (recombination protein O)